MTPATETSALPDSGASCCAVYEMDWVRVLLGHSFHPGGEELTRRGFEALGLKPGERMADIGCGTGSSAMVLAKASDVLITGVDLSPLNAAEARRRLGGAASVVCGDAQTLPFADNSFQGLMAECSFSLAPDQAAALREYRRVLAPGRRMVLSDMGLEGQLAADLAEVAAPWTCLVGAHSRKVYSDLFRSYGFQVLQTSDESEGLLSMIRRIKRKLVLAGAGAALAGNISVPDFDLATVRHWLDRIKTEVKTGNIQYLSFTLQASSAQTVNT